MNFRWQIEYRCNGGFELGRRHVGEGFVTDWEPNPRYCYWALLAAAAITAVGTIAANKEAADEASDTAEAAQDKSLAELREGKARAIGRLDPYVGHGAAGITHLRQTLATPEHELTESQKIGLEDYSRRAQNNLAASGLSGSSAGVRSFDEGLRRYIAGAQDTNRARRDSAGNILAQQGFSASQGQANADLGTGSNIANLIYGTGRRLGELQGDSITASANQAGEIFGALASRMAEDDRKGRPSRYVDE